VISPGKITFRDLTRNVSVLVSNAHPQRLLEFQRSVKRALGGPKTPPKWTPPSPTSPWSRAQKRRMALSPVCANKKCRHTPATAAKGAGVKSDDRVKLSPQQQAVVDMAEDGTSFFLTGGAGTGKSVILREVIQRLPAATTFVTAPTGVAALNIGGSTIHEFAGLGRGDLAPHDVAAKITRGEAGNRWRRATTLIIDEVSMLSAKTFDTLDSLARLLRPAQSHLPFGGIQVVACGDFFQLPPVSGRDEGETAKLCFESSSWARALPVAVELQQVYRQKDAQFIKLLEHLRWGRCNPEVIAMLKSRQLAAGGGSPSGAPQGSGASSEQLHREGEVRLRTRLMTHRADVERVNGSQLLKLAGEQRTYDAKDEGHEVALRTLDRGCTAPRTLHLKIDAQVMLTKTINRFRGLVNGARGQVVSFSSGGSPRVKFENGEVETVLPETWSVAFGYGCRASRTQIPLQLAWAMSIHKAQGISLSHVDVSLANVFEPGQAYVAISRVRSLQGLGIIDFAPSSIRANPKVVAFYKALAGAPVAGDAEDE